MPEVHVVSADLSGRETIEQIADVLDRLDNVTEEVFQKVTDRIQDQLDRLRTLDRRIDAARSKVEKLSRPSDSPKVIVSSAKYPGKAYSDTTTCFAWDEEAAVARGAFSGASAKSGRRPTGQGTKLVFTPIRGLDQKQINEKLHFYHVRPRRKAAPFDVDAESFWRDDTSVRSQDVDEASALLVFNSKELAFQSPNRQVTGNENAPSETTTPDRQKESTGMASNSKNIRGPSNDEGSAGPHSALPMPNPRSVSPKENAQHHAPTPMNIMMLSTIPVPPPPPFPTTSSFQADDIPDAGERGPLSTAPRPSRDVDKERVKLMEAIRSAGGLERAGLRSTKDHLDRLSQEEGDARGDLMSDLTRKLSLRRRGIAGQGKTTTEATLHSISARIPQPQTERGLHSETDDADDEWLD